MTTRPMIAALAGILWLLALSAGADVWDVQAPYFNDDTSLGTNTLRHGETQIHDLGARPGPTADQDWYRVTLLPYGSYEVRLEGLTGELARPSVPGGVDLRLDRIDSDGVTLVSSSAGSGPTLSGQNTGGSWLLNYIRVWKAGCTTACGPDDAYTVRMRETTVSVPRWNVSSTQTTVLLVQTSHEAGADMNLLFFSEDGTLLHHHHVLQLNGTVQVLNLATLPQLVGRSGHLKIVNTAPYGSLNVKAVALEASTGFTFDTPGTYIPY